MLREYGVDLDAAIETRSIRPMVLLDLVEHLSPTASLWRAIDPDMAWTPDRMLLATLIDEIRVLRWEFERVHFRGKPTRPEPIPRPGVERPVVEVDKVKTDGGFDTIAEFDAWYAEAKERQRSRVST